MQQLTLTMSTHTSVVANVTKLLITTFSTAFILFGALLTIHLPEWPNAFGRAGSPLFTPLAHAASCTNTYTSGTAAPIGYAAAWNPLTAARELLVQATDCTAGVATVTIGTGADSMYVHRKGYAWTGTTWREHVLSSTSKLESSAWYKGFATSAIAVSTSTQTHFVAYACQYQDSAWKCGCKDSSCTTSAWQLQSIRASDESSGTQCTGSTAPPQAAAQGLTKLVFCEDFSDPSRIDFENKPVQGKTTFVAMRPGNIFSAAAESKNDFTFTSDGTLESRSQATNYQADFISTWPMGGGSYGGYAVSKNSTGWYVESRLKHNTWSGSKGFYAFWSMATCKIYASGPGCVEPDFYEYIDGKMIHAVHWYPTGGTNDGRKSAMCSVTPNSDRTQFFTTGALYGPGNAYVRWYDNEQLTCEKTSTSYPYLSYMANQDFPIIFGTGPSQPYTIDWIRVWVKP